VVNGSDQGYHLRVFLFELFTVIRIPFKQHSDSTPLTDLNTTYASNCRRHYPSADCCEKQALKRQARKKNRFSCGCCTAALTQNSQSRNRV
jgi:hypothetical protein